MSLFAQIPKHERPREKLWKEGADALSLQELIAILLGTGTRGKTVLALAQELLLHFGGIRGLLEASSEELMEVKGIGRAKAMILKAAFSIAKKSRQESLIPNEKIKNAKDAFELAKMFIGDLKQEALLILLRDVRGRLIHREVIGLGTLSEVLVHPREVFNPAVRYRANSLILVHNHPSGDPTPSKADFELTSYLVRSSKILGIFLDDHIILGDDCFTSLREKGFLGEPFTY